MDRLPKQHISALVFTQVHVSAISINRFSGRSSKYSFPRKTLIRSFSDVSIGFIELTISHQVIPVSSSVNLPGIYDIRIRDRGVIIRADSPKQIAIWIEMQDAGFRNPPAAETLFFTAVIVRPIPDIVNDQRRTTA